MWIRCTPASLSQPTRPDICRTRSDAPPLNAELIGDDRLDPRDAVIERQKAEGARHGIARLSRRRAPSFLFRQEGDRAKRIMPRSGKKLDREAVGSKDALCRRSRQCRRSTFDQARRAPVGVKSAQTTLCGALCAQSERSDQIACVMICDTAKGVRDGIFRIFGRISTIGKSSGELMREDQHTAGQRDDIRCRNRTLPQLDMRNAQSARKSARAGQKRFRTQWSGSQPQVIARQGRPKLGQENRSDERRRYPNDQLQHILTGRAQREPLSLQVPHRFAEHESVGERTAIGKLEQTALNKSSDNRLMCNISLSGNK